MCGLPAREREQKIHKYCRRHTHTLPRESPALSGEQIDQVREEKGAVLPSQKVFKRLGGLVSGRWQAQRKVLVCSSFLGERKLGFGHCEKNAQVRPHETKSTNDHMIKSANVLSHSTPSTFNR